MQLSTIHLNGTSKEALVKALCDASEALEAAYQSLKQTTPNGRDYYPQGNQALKVALDEHDSRLRRVDSVKKEIDELTIAVDNLPA